MGMKFFEFNRQLDEHYTSVLSLYFEDGFGLIYAVEPVIWLESNPLQLSNFECSFRINLWEVARYFEPSLFFENDVRGLTLHWGLFDSARQLEEAASDLLSCHKQLYEKYFSQFQFPKPLTEISVEGHPQWKV